MIQSIVCAGIFSSGSTWLYNVVIKLAELKYGDNMVNRFFSNSVDNFPEDAFRKFNVIKCHVPAFSLDVLMKLTHTPAIITIRDPRDAVASLRERFGIDIYNAADNIRKSANAIVQFTNNENCILLRYEDRFFEKESTIHDIAKIMGIAVSEAIVRDLHENFCADSVKKKIDILKDAGVFRSKSKVASFDPATHWHLNHIGDTKVGKYSILRSKIEQDGISEETSTYCKKFGYESNSTSNIIVNSHFYWRYAISSGETLQFRSGSPAKRVLISGWSHLEGDFVCCLGLHSKLLLSLPLTRVDISICIRMRPVMYPKRNIAQRLVILANGQRAYKGLLRADTEIELRLPSKLLSKGILKLVMIHPDRARPRDHVLHSNDSRELSVRMVSLTMSESASTTV